MTTPIDLDELANRVLAIRRGELPADAVTDDELRAAIQQQRERFKASAEKATKRASPAKKSTARDFDFSGVSLPADQTGSLF